MSRLRCLAVFKLPLEWNVSSGTFDLIFCKLFLKELNAEELIIA